MQTPSATQYNAIYLAPHLDDVALSCGGQVFDRTESGEHVLIVTVIAKSCAHGRVRVHPPVSTIGGSWPAMLPPNATPKMPPPAILGADYLHLDVPDCIYRLSPEDGTPLYNSDFDIFGEIHPAEAKLAEHVGRFSARCPPARSSLH